jgi:hypothetical protein
LKHRSPIRLAEVGTNSHPPPSERSKAMASTPSPEPWIGATSRADLVVMGFTAVRTLAIPDA